MQETSIVETNKFLPYGNTMYQNELILKGCRTRGRAIRTAYLELSNNIDALKENYFSHRLNLVKIAKLKRKLEEDIERYKDIRTQVEMREIRDNMLSSLDWKISRLVEQEYIGIIEEPNDEKKKLYEYRQYLRDYPNKPEIVRWWDKVPLTYEEWLEYEVEVESIRD